MKNKNLIIGVTIAAVVIAILFIAKPFKPKASQPKQAAKAAEKIPAKTAARKPISKDRGGLTVKIMGAKGKELMVRLRAFKASDARSSVYASTFASNRMEELSPGRYDIEIDTVPQKLYKGIDVAQAKETVADLGRITGTLTVKALNAKNKEASYPVRIRYPKSSTNIATTVAGRPVEIVVGVYDIEVAVVPTVVETNVKIGPDKDTVLDLGALTGTLIVTALEEGKKELRYGIRVRKTENNEIVTTGTTGRPIEIRQGTYTIELLSSPVQTKKDVKVNAGAESNIEFTVQLLAERPLPTGTAPAVVKEAPPAKAAAPAPAKK